MKQLTLDAFIGLGWSSSVAAKLDEMSHRPEVQFLVAWDNAGKLSASAFTEPPDAWPDTAVAIWRRHPLPEAAAETVKSKTQQAVDLVRQGVTPNAAAKQLGVHPSAVYRALTRALEKPLCPCCKQVVREGFEIDQSVLKSPARAPGDA